MTGEEAIAWFENWLLDYYDIDDMPQELTAELAGIALAALRQQEHFREDTKKVEPLTLDELRKMDGDPVWIVWPDGRIKSKWWIVNSVGWMDMFWDDHGNISNDYGTVWTAYRQNPEKGTV